MGTVQRVFDRVKNNSPSGPDIVCSIFEMPLWEWSTPGLSSRAQYLL